MKKFLGIIVFLIVCIGIYNIMIKTPKYVIDDNQYHIESGVCNYHPTKIYAKLLPNDFCEEKIVKNNNVVRQVKITTDSQSFRTTPENFSTSKKRIVVFGGSVPFGEALNDNESFSWLLSKDTNEKVYNASLPAGGLQHILIYLMSNAFKENLENVDHFIYVYSDNDLSQLFGPPFPKASVYYPKFKLINNKLVLVPPSFLYNLGKPLAKLASSIDYKKKVKKEKDNEATLELFTPIIKKIDLLIKEQYPNAKFIVLNFDNNEQINQVLKDNKIKYINRKDIFNEPDMENKYFNLEYLPNAEFWQKFTPLFVQKLKLKD